MYQSITIVGYLGQEPRLQYTPTGIAVCNFNVAVNKTTGKGQDRKRTVTWFQCTCWRQSAESAYRALYKAARVLIVGEVSCSAYLDRNGKPAASLELTADVWQLLDNRAERAETLAADEPIGALPF